MAFWTDGLNAQTKRAFRWFAIFNSLDTWLCKSVSKPSFAISETSHRFINHTFFYPGRVEWNTVDITLVDPVSPDGTKTIMHIIEAAGYSPPDAAVPPWRTVSKAKAILALQKLEIYQTDDEGVPIERWELRNPWIKDVKFGDLSYDSDEILTMSMTIRYDWAELWTKFPSNPGSAPIAPSRGFPSKSAGVAS